MRLLRRLLWRLLSAGMWRHEYYCLQGYDIIEVTVCMDVTSWKLCDAMDVTVVGMWRHKFYRLMGYDVM